jgi:hypothetical protein
VLIFGYIEWPASGSNEWLGLIYFVRLFFLGLLVVTFFGVLFGSPWFYLGASWAAGFCFVRVSMASLCGAVLEVQARYFESFKSRAVLMS